MNWKIIMVAVIVGITSIGLLYFFRRQIGGANVRNAIANRTARFPLGTGGAILTLIIVAGIIAAYWNFSAFGCFWLTIILLSVAFGVSAFFLLPVRAWLGNYVGHLLTDNNYRHCLLGILAIIISLSACFAGFGAPLFSAAVEEYAVPKIKETDQNNPSIKGEIKYILFGDRKTKVSTFTPPKSKSAKEYHSWWWWIWAFILWLVFIIYTPIAYRDEAKEAWHEAVEAVHRRRNIAITGTVTTASAEGGGVSNMAIGWSSFLRRFIPIDIFMEFGEIFVKKIIGSIKGGMK